MIFKGRKWGWHSVKKTSIVNILILAWLRSQSYQTLISLFFWFLLLLGLAISKYRQYFLMLQTLKFYNKKRKKILLYNEKNLVGLTQGLGNVVFCRTREGDGGMVDKLGKIWPSFMSFEKIVRTSSTASRNM